MANPDYDGNDNSLTVIIFIIITLLTLLLHFTGNLEYSECTPYYYGDELTSDCD